MRIPRTVQMPPIACVGTECDGGSLGSLSGGGLGGAAPHYSKADPDGSGRRRL